ncbi:hypothetical protein M3Y95_00175400 [Aphelenchoides besseyi]|nr:hypothetical protein M3Y95_00175400 [Aphelenchoides besseyi]
MTAGAEVLDTIRLTKAKTKPRSGIMKDTKKAKLVQDIGIIPLVMKTRAKKSTIATKQPLNGEANLKKRSVEVIVKIGVMEVPITGDTAMIKKEVNIKTKTVKSRRNTNLKIKIVSILIEDL